MNLEDKSMSPNKIRESIETEKQIEIIKLTPTIVDSLDINDADILTIEDIENDQHSES